MESSCEKEIVWIIRVQTCIRLKTSTGVKASIGVKTQWGSVLNLVVYSKMGRSVSLNEPKPSAIQRFVDSASRSLGSTSRFLLIGRVVLLVLLVQYLLYIGRSVFKVTPPLWESKVLLVLNTHTHALRARFIGKQCFSLSSSLPSQEIRLSLFG